MQHNQRDIDEQRRRQPLNDADDRGLPTGFAQRRKPEFIADGKCDKAERDFAEHLQAVQLFHRRKTDSGDAQPAEAVRADQHARNQIGRYRGQRKALDHARHHKAGDYRHGEG